MSSLGNTHSNIPPHTSHSHSTFCSSKRETPRGHSLSFRTNAELRVIIEWQRVAHRSIMDWFFTDFPQLWAIESGQLLAHDLQFIINKSSLIPSCSFSCLHFHRLALKKRHTWVTSGLQPAHSKRGCEGPSFRLISQAQKTTLQCTSWACVNKVWRKATVAYWLL